MAATNGVVVHAEPKPRKSKHAELRQQLTAWIAENPTKPASEAYLHFGGAQATIYRLYKEIKAAAPAPEVNSFAGIGTTTSRWFAGVGTTTSAMYDFAALAGMGVAS